MRFYNHYQFIPERPKTDRPKATEGARISIRIHNNHERSRIGSRTMIESKTTLQGPCFNSSPSSSRLCVRVRGMVLGVGTRSSAMYESIFNIGIASEEAEKEAISCLKERGLWLRPYNIINSRHRTPLMIVSGGI